MMVTKFTAAFAVFAVLLSFINLERAAANPAIGKHYNHTSNPSHTYDLSKHRFMLIP